MLQNKSQIFEAIKTVSSVLGELNEDVVYVGGAVTALYADDPGAPEVRPTKDIDIVLEIASQQELDELRQKLAERGIYFAQDENVICRFKYQNILLDVMATKEVGWAPANPWFKAGFNYPEIRQLDEVKIKIMPVTYFLASKFSAFEDRGRDPRTSHDFEDIVYILDNRITLVSDIMESEAKVKAFLAEKFKAVLNNALLQEAVLANLEPVTQTRRYEILEQKLRKIIK